MTQRTTHFSHKGIVGAALAIREDCALYAELLRADDEYSIVGADIFELPAGLVEEDHIKDSERLGAFLRKKCAFRWGKLPLALGLPSSDCIFRTISLPLSDLDEARESMRWGFSDFFPFQYEDALFDLCEIPTPQTGNVPYDAGLQFIGVACEKKVVMPLLEALKNSRSLVQAAEPSCVACARAFSQPGEVGTRLLVAGIGNVAHLVFFSLGEAVLFRTLSGANGDGAKIDGEIRATLEYVAEKFHADDVRLHLAGNLPQEIYDLPSSNNVPCAVQGDAEIFRALKIDLLADVDPFDVAGLLLRYRRENRI